MQEFCAYKMKDYDISMEKFLLLDLLEKKTINQFRYHFLYGRILRLKGQNEKALDKFKTALDINKKNFIYNLQEVLERICSFFGRF